MERSDSGVVLRVRAGLGLFKGCKAFDAENC